MVFSNANGNTHQEIFVNSIESHKGIKTPPDIDVSHKHTCFNHIS